MGVGVLWPQRFALDDIIDGLEMQFDEMSSFLDLDTGQVETVSHDLLHAAEKSDAPDHLPDWEKEAWRVAKRIVSTDRFRELPTKFEVHEIQEDLLYAIHGAGAFRHFKATARRIESNRIGSRSGPKR